MSLSWRPRCRFCWVLSPSTSAKLEGSRRSIQETQREKPPTPYLTPKFWPKSSDFTWVSQAFEQFFVVLSQRRLRSWCFRVSEYDTIHTYNCPTYVPWIETVRSSCCVQIFYIFYTLSTIALSRFPCYITRTSNMTQALSSYIRHSKRDRSNRTETRLLEGISTSSG